MQDRPSVSELLRAVRGFLEDDLVPALEGRRRFHALVAANVLSIALRQLRGEEANLVEEWRLLSSLLGEAGEMPCGCAQMRDGVRALNERLCAAIRAGEFDGERFDEAAEVVRLLVVRKLEVANPRYLEADAHR